MTTGRGRYSVRADVEGQVSPELVAGADRLENTFEQLQASSTALRQRIGQLDDTTAIRDIERQLELLDQAINTARRSSRDLTDDIARVDEGEDDIGRTRREVEQLTDSLNEARRAATGLRSDIGEIDGQRVGEAGGGAGSGGGLGGVAGRIGEALGIGGLIRGGRAGLIAGVVGGVLAAGGAAIGLSTQRRGERLEAQRAAQEFGVTGEQAEAAQRAARVLIPALGEGTTAIELLAELGREAGRETQLDPEGTREALARQGVPADLQERILRIPEIEDTLRRSLELQRVTQELVQRGFRGAQLEAIIDEVVTGTEAERFAGFARRGELPNLINITQAALQPIRTPQEEASLRGTDVRLGELSNQFDRLGDRVSTAIAEVVNQVPAPQITVENIDARGRDAGDTAEGVRRGIGDAVRESYAGRR